MKNPINYSVLRSKFQLENLNVLLIIQVVVAQLVSIEFLVLFLDRSLTNQIVNLSSLVFALAIYKYCSSIPNLNCST